MMRAVATSPQIPLLDEPVAGMNDVEAGKELGEVFQEAGDQRYRATAGSAQHHFVNQLCCRFIAGLRR